MKKRTLLSLLFAVGLSANAQQLRLDDCISDAKANYPLIRQKGLAEKSRDYTVANAGKGWLPTVSVTASAAAMTDIADIPATAAQLTGDIKNSLYGVTMNVSQKIYDGGATSSAKSIAHAEAEADKSQTAVGMYAVRTRVEQIFFGILTIDEQLRQNRLLQDDISLSRSTVAAMVKGGVANQTDLDAVDVETVKTRQRETALQQSRKAYVRVLGLFVGKTLPADVTLDMPKTDMPQDHGDVLRPELAAYAAREQLLDRRRKALDIRLRPRLDAFALASWHNRMIGMMNTYNLAAGLTLRWNIGSLYTRQNDIRSIQNDRDRIATERQTFLFDNAMERTSAQGDIEGLEKQIALDDTIIALRQNIRRTAERRVRGGTLTVSEMLRDINAVSEARLQKALHKLRLTQEICRLRTIEGK